MKLQLWLVSNAPLIDHNIPKDSFNNIIKQTEVHTITVLFIFKQVNILAEDLTT